MALMKCIDCGNEVSTAAKACPRCGRPTPIKEIPAVPNAAVVSKPVGVTEIATIAVVLGVLLIGVVRGCGPTQPTNTAPVTPVVAETGPKPPSRMDFEVAAKSFVHNALIQSRGDALPDKWADDADVIRRDGNRAIVLVRTGIKDGFLSELVVLQNYVVGISYADDNDHYSTTAATPCGKRRPTEDQISAVMREANWPGQ